MTSSSGKVRCEHAEEVAEEKEQDADVKEVAAQSQLADLEQLGRIAFPGVLIPVKAKQAAQKENG